jgi:GTPase SAR1 family protein
LGDAKVGKTSIVRRIVDDTFNRDYDNTVNYDIVRDSHTYFDIVL